MKNLYLNFCKLATLVLMVGLSARYISLLPTNFIASAQQATCPNTAPWVKVDGLSDISYTYDVPEGKRVVEWCWKASTAVQYGTAGTPSTDSITVTSTEFNSPGGATCTAIGVPHQGCNLQDLSHASFRLEDIEEEEEESEVPSMSSSVSCGRIDMTFSNPTNWFFSFDYRVDGEAGHADEYTNMQIANGPFAGQFFGQRFNEVDVMANSTQSRTVTFAEDSGTHTVEYRLFRGAENDLYLNWESKEINSNCQRDIYGCTDEEATNYNAEATHDDESCVYPSSTPTPTPTPTPSPDPTEPPGYNCPVAQSCPSACGQAASDVPNGSCGFNHCDPTPSCDGGIGGGSQGQVLGTSTMSGQVLGASTYAATGVVEDALFSLMGVVGAGLSGAGILLKRNEKRQK